MYACAFVCHSLLRCVNGLKQQGYLGLMLRGMNTVGLCSETPPALPWAEIRLDCPALAAPLLREVRSCRRHGKYGVLLASEGLLPLD